VIGTGAILGAALHMKRPNKGLLERKGGKQTDSEDRGNDGDIPTQSQRRGPILPSDKYWIEKREKNGKRGESKSYVPARNCKEGQTSRARTTRRRSGDGSGGAWCDDGSGRRTLKQGASDSAENEHVTGRNLNTLCSVREAKEVVRRGLYSEVARAGKKTEIPR